MKLLWLTVSGEYAQQLSGDLIAAGYSATEIASTGDFLHYGNTILLLCIEAEKVGALTAFIRSRMNAYRHLEDDPDKSSPASDFALYSIPLSDYQKVGGYHANEKKRHAFQRSSCNSFRKTKGVRITASIWFALSIPSSYQALPGSSRCSSSTFRTLPCWTVMSSSSRETRRPCSNDGRSSQLFRSPSSPIRISVRIRSFP